MENIKFVCPNCGFESEVTGSCPNCHVAMVASCATCGNPVVGEQVYQEV